MMGRAATLPPLGQILLIPPLPKGITEEFRPAKDGLGLSERGSTPLRQRRIFDARPLPEHVGRPLCSPQKRQRVAKR